MDFARYMSDAILVLLVFASSVVGTGLLRSLALRHGWLARARSDRWHKRPTALFGGVGFFPGFAVAVLYLLLRDADDLGLVSSWVNQAEFRLVAALLTGASMMFCLGWADDIKNYRPATKLVAQLVAASPFIFVGGVFNLTGIPLIDMLISYFWFFGVTNAVNLLDNMDGLATGVALISAVSVVALMIHGGAVTTSAIQIGMSFAAMLFGFWLFNRPPASIFMGDSGSLSIGFTLAALAMPSPLNNYFGVRGGEQLLGPLMALLIPVAVLAVPIFDTTFVTITRKLRARKASQGGRDHTSHRLVLVGLDEKQAIWVLYMLAAFGGGMAVMMQRFADVSLPLFVVFVLVLVFVGTYLGHVKVMEVGEVEPKSAWIPIIGNILYKRRAAEVVLDIVLVVTSFYSAYLLRFEGAIPDVTMRAVEKATPLVMAACLMAFFLSGVYRGQWRWFSLQDVPRFMVGVVGGVVGSLALVALVTRFEVGHSRSAFLIFSLLLFLFMVGSRVSLRMIDMLLHHEKRRSARTLGKRVLIYGAGKTGKLLQEATLADPALMEYVVIGFIDDDPRKSGRRLNNLPVHTKQEWQYRQIDVGELWISSRDIADNVVTDFISGLPQAISIKRLRFALEPVAE